MGMSRTVKFKDFVSLQRGFDLPNSMRANGNIPIVASTGISGYHDVSKVSAPGVVTGRSGSLGTVQYIDKDFWPLNTSLWVKHFKGNVPKYVYYYLQTMRLEQYNSGAGVPTLNRNDLDAIEIVIHDSGEQIKIANTLSTYDSLIENNNRRIAILEELAQRLYREWFVHFRFPGHESINMVESELGLIPEGWEVGRLSDIADIIMGQSPPSTYYNETGNGLPFHQGVTNFTSLIPDHKLFSTKGNRIAEKDDILFSVRAPVGRINIADQKMVLGRGVSAIRNKKQHQAFLLFLLRNNFDKPDIIGNGAIFNSVTKDDMYGIKLIVPKIKIEETFNSLVAPIVKMLISLSRKNTNLRKTRDLLLPRLILGDIDVSDLPIKAEED